MKLLAISDLHIQVHGDAAQEFFQKFKTLAASSDATDIVLLGDIFDVMVGSQRGYLSDYKWYFDDITSLLTLGKNVYFIEGNHDFHLDRIFALYLKDKQLKGKFTYSKGPVNFQIGRKNFVFMHGDDLDLDVAGYQRWKRIYTSLPFRVFVNHLLPYPVARWLGDKASSDSKERNRKNFDYEGFQTSYRKKVQAYFEANPDVDALVAGHTHIKDKWVLGDKVYLNAGYARVHQSYICVSESIIEVLAI